MSKKLFVTKGELLGTFAKYAISQSPYTRPDNLELVVDLLDKAIAPTFEEASLNVAEFDNWQALEAFLGESLATIAPYTDWNDRKNGNPAPMQFTSRYDSKVDPDDDFIDLDALQRNVATEIERNQA